MRQHKYILDGHNPVPVEDPTEWALWYEGSCADNAAGRRVGYTSVRAGVHVSTVFLAIDHNHFGVGPPILFETMVFRDGEGCEQERYSTWDEAEAGHARIVADVEAEVSEPAR